MPIAVLCVDESKEIKMKFLYQLNNLLHNKTVRNGGLFSIYSFFNKGVSFVVMIILARYISPEEYGELSLFSTFVMFLSYFVGLSTSGYLSVSFFKCDKENFHKDFSSICSITFIVTLIISVIFLIFRNQFSGLLKISTEFIFIGITIAFIQVFTSLNLDYLRVQEKVSKYGLLSCSFAILLCITTLYLVIEKNLSWTGKVYSELFTYIIYGIIAVICFIKSDIFNFKINWYRCKTIIFWGLPIIPHLASNWIKSGLDRYIIEYTHTMSDVGIFSFAFSLTSIITIVGSAFNQTNSVNLYQILSNKNITKNDKLSSLHRKEKYFSIVYLFATLVIILFGCISIPLVMPNYIASIPFFIILAVYGFLQCIYFLFCNYLFYYNKTKNLMYITFCTAILHLVLSLLLTKYSLYYTCLVYVISQTIIVVLVYMQVKRIIKENLN